MPGIHQLVGLLSLLSAIVVFEPCALANFSGVIRFLWLALLW